MKFLDRVEERTRLMKLLNGAEGALACLYGRRRCGKTRLLHECVADLPNTIYYLADRSERPAQLARFVKEASRTFPAMAAAMPGDWGGVLDLSAVCGSDWLQPSFRNMACRGLMADCEVAGDGGGVDSTVFRWK